MSKVTNPPQTTGHSATVQKAAARAGTLAKTRAPKVEYTEEQKAAFKEMQKAHRAQRSHFSSFPVNDICVITEANGRSKVVLRDETTGQPDPKAKAVMELCPLVSVPGSRTKGYGNAGTGEHKPSYIEAKRSLGLALGSCDDAVPLPPDWEADQQLCAQVVPAAARAALGAWFDGNAAKECEAGYNSAMAIARAGFVGQQGLAKRTDVIAREQSDPAFAADVLAAAREAFIEGGKIPLTTTFVDGKEMKPVIWITNKIFALPKGKYSPSVKAPKGPTTDEIPALGRNRRQIQKSLKAYGYEEKLPVYEAMHKGESPRAGRSNSARRHGRPDQVSRRDGARRRRARQSAVRLEPEARHDRAGEH